jgi:hypothetical protein
MGGPLHVAEPRDVSVDAIDPANRHSTIQYGFFIFSSFSRAQYNVFSSSFQDHVHFTAQVITNVVVILGVHTVMAHASSSFYIQDVQ